MFETKQTAVERRVKKNAFFWRSQKKSLFGSWLLVTLMFVFNLLFHINSLAMTPSQESQYTNLTKEIRCVVCQNQNIADSDAPLAKDLRKKISTMVEENKSDKEIKDYLVARYGEFILLKPRFNKLTLVLWLFPFICLLAVGLLAVYFFWPLRLGDKTLKKSSSKSPS